jgi:hypothetical protein
LRWFDDGGKTDDKREDTAMNVALTLVKESEEELTVGYAEMDTGENPLLAEGLVLRRSALPDPPPQLMHILLRWEQDATASGTIPAEAEYPLPRGATSWRDEVKVGDHLTVIKSRSAGVKSPPEWLEQYVGRTGVVLWTTADGAMLDIDGKASWFSYQELKRGA